MLYSFNCFDCRRAITLFNNYQEIIQTDISRASEKRVLSVKICCNGENPRVLILVQALFAAHRYVQQTSIFREEESYFFCGLISREIEQTFEIVYSSQVVAKTQKLALHAFFVRLSALE